MRFKARYLPIFTGLQLPSKKTSVFFALFFAVSIYGLVSIYDNSIISKDTIQSLSVAKNLLKGNGITTTVIYYQTQHDIGGIPVPQTVFPPGYPFMIALISMLGISPRLTAFLLSLVCFNLIALYIYQIARISGHKKNTCFILTAVWFFFVPNWFYALKSMSEMTFIFCTVLSFRCIIQSEISSKKRWIFIASLFASLAFTVRYAGIFFVMSLAIFYLIDFLRKKNLNAFYEFLSATLLPLFTVLVLFTRNYILAGGFRGALEYGSEKSVTSISYKCYVALRALFGFSWSGIVKGQIQELLMIILVLLWFFFFIIKFNKLRVNKDAFSNIFINVTSFFSSIYIIISLFFLTYIEITSLGGIASRYLVPLIPFCLLLIPDLIRVIYYENGYFKKIKYFLTLSVLVMFLLGQSNVFLSYWKRLVQDNHFRIIHYSLQKPFLSGTLYDFLTERARLDSPILGEPGQVVGGVLDRPTIALPPSRYTSKIWSFNEVKKIVQRYNVHYILFYPQIFNIDGDDDQLFFMELKKGNLPPWLKPISSTPEMVLYEVSNLEDTNL